MSSIIIVDDQGTNLRVMAKLAATLGDDIEIMSFSDPLEALLYIRQHTPDLLITDYQMPNIDGAELIRRFRNVPDCGDVPTVVVTTYENPEFRSLAMAAGTTDFLLSPVDHQAFRARTRDLLAVRAAHQVARRQEAALGVADQAAASDQGAPDKIEIFNALLETMCARLLDKIKELDRSDGDLQNLMEVSAIPAVFVDENLRIRRFTPEIAAIYSLTPQDIGTSLLSIACNCAYGDLESDFRRVSEMGEVSQRYLESRDGGQHYLMRMLPVHIRDRSIGGATIAFVKLSAWYSGRA